MNHYLTEQYSGPRARLRPIVDAIIERAVVVCPGCKVVAKRDCVDLVRTKKFAAIFPDGDDVVVALVLDGIRASGGLESVESFGSPITHWMRVRLMSEVDPELSRRMNEAWERA